MGIYKKKKEMDVEVKKNKRALLKKIAVIY